VLPQAADLCTVGTDTEAAMVAFCTSCPNFSLEPGTRDEVEVSTIQDYTILFSKHALYLPVSCMACHNAQGQEGRNGHCQAICSV